MDLNMLDISCFKTSLSKSLIMLLVSDIGLSWLHTVNGDSFGMGLILAVFHADGTVCWPSDLLKTLVITGAR